MPVPSESRKYDIVLLGANGYTGALTAEHIVRHLPTNLRWALAGRSGTKLEALAGKLKSLNPDRLQPDIEVVSFEDRESLHGLMKNAKVCISAVLYWTVGAQVIEACIENQTDYIDTEGDTPMTREWCDKFHAKAAANNTILVHSCGMFSAPQDLLSLAAVQELSNKYSLETREIVLAEEEIPPEFSGGTIEALGNRINASPEEQRQAESDPWYLSPKRGTTRTATFANFLGLRRDPVFGVLAVATYASTQNRAIVHRAWGLQRGRIAGYGPNFQYNEYVKVSSVLTGVFHVLGHFLVTTALNTRFIYNFLRKSLPSAGEGPDVEKSRQGIIRLAVQAIAEEARAGGETPRRVVAHFTYKGGPYLATAMFLAEGAASLLHNRAVGGDIPGGCLTPALLGDDLLNRVQRAGVEIDFSYP